MAQLDALTLCSLHFGTLDLFILSMHHSEDMDHCTQDAMSQPTLAESQFTPILPQSMPDFSTPSKDAKNPFRLFLSPETGKTPIRNLSGIETPIAPSQSQSSFVPYTSPSKFRRVQMTPMTPLSLEVQPLIRCVT